MFFKNVFKNLTFNCNCDLLQSIKVLNKFDGIRSSQHVNSYIQCSTNKIGFKVYSYHSDRTCRNLASAKQKYLKNWASSVLFRVGRVGSRTLIL